MKNLLSHASLLILLLVTFAGHFRWLAAASGQGAAPELLGRALLGQANDVVVSGMIAHLATSSGLSIAEVSDPTNPVERGRLLLPGEALTVAVSQDHVYLASGREGFFIVNVSDPARPQVVAHMNSQYAADVAVVGTLGYFADAESLVIFDLTEPDFPIALNALNLSGFARAIVINDDLGYVAVGEAGVDLIDVSDPMEPQLLATVDTPGEALGVAVSDQLAFIADGTSLIVLDVSAPTQPRQLQQFIIDGLVSDVSVEGETLYATGTFEAGVSQLSIISTLIPSRLRITGTVNFAGEAVRLTVSENRAYIAARCEGLIILDVFRRDNPRLMGTYAEPSCFNDVAAFETTVYLTRRMKDAAIVDASDPANPRPVGSISGPVQRVVRSGKILAGADGEGVTFYSLENPASPSRLSQLKLPETTIHALAASETLVGISTDEAIILVDISNPRRPRRRSEIPGRAFQLAFDGDRLFAARGTEGLSVFDVSNPNRPRIVADVAAKDPLFGTTSVMAGGGRVFLGEPFTGVRIFSLSPMTHLDEIGRYEAPSPLELIVKDMTLYIADPFRGLEIVNVADPARPTLIGSFNPGGMVTSLALEGDRVYLLDSRSGVWILQP